MPPPAEGLASRLFLGPALRTQPDRRLVALVREGYESAFEEIVRRYGQPLGRYAASIVGGRSEDVLQDAFAKALPALQRDGAEIDLRPWLFRIVRNTALNDLRDSPPTPELLAEALAGGGNPAEELERREELADLMRRLRELPDAQRAAIVMRELEGLGHEEIAAALGLSGGGARQAIFRARQALRDGAGMLLPLPLLRLLIEHGTDVATAGAGAGGALTAAGATAGGAGAGGALKLGVVAVVVAGSVGAGVAVENQHGGERAGAAAISSGRERPAAPSPAPLTPRAIGALAIGGSGRGGTNGSRHGGGDSDNSGGGGGGHQGHGVGGNRGDNFSSEHSGGPGPAGSHPGPPHRGGRGGGFDDANRGEHDGRGLQGGGHGGEDRSGGGERHSDHSGGGGSGGPGGEHDYGSGGEVRSPDESGHGGDDSGHGGPGPGSPPPPPPPQPEIGEEEGREEFRDPRS
jgi:RNA polymerase sigma factor (sigma-70 family)